MAFDVQLRDRLISVPADWVEPSKEWFIFKVGDTEIGRYRKEAVVSMRKQRAKRE